MMLLAQSTYEMPATIGAWLGCLLAVLMLFNAGGKAWDRLNGKSKVPQPLTVEIAKQLHEQFADKTFVETHVKDNTTRHGQLFSAINKVEREAREAMEERFTELNDERRATLEKLNEQFTFIRENIAAINRELQIRNRP